MTKDKGKIHFIAIGGSVMHNLAVALHKSGFKVTGSDDELFEPSKSRLSDCGILPESAGWFPEKITEDLTAVIIGMHAKEDNPEYLKAKELGLKIYSYPEFIFEHAKEKQRIVIAGSHGKTTVTAIVLHVLQFYNKKFDYLIGGLPGGFESTVRLSDDAPIMIIEGDEYLTSPTDRRPKFLVYQHHIGVITGIARDHINVYPTEESYLAQFESFAKASVKAGSIIYNEEDKRVKAICKQASDDVFRFPYSTLKHKTAAGGATELVTDFGKFIVPLVGKHNVSNLTAAKTVCQRIGITENMFFEAVQSFKGVKNRLEVLVENDRIRVIKDFAHAPSKVKATVAAVKSHFPDKKLTACLELHTFSSLDKNFINEYKDSLSSADTAAVFADADTVRRKGLEPLSENEIRAAFNRKDLLFISDQHDLQQFLTADQQTTGTLLLMSSGHFGGFDITNYIHQLNSHKN